MKLTSIFSWTEPQENSLTLRLLISTIHDYITLEYTMEPSKFRKLALFTWTCVELEGRKEVVPT